MQPEETNDYRLSRVVDLIPFDQYLRYFGFSLAKVGLEMKWSTEKEHESKLIVGKMCLVVLQD